MKALVYTKNGTKKGELVLNPEIFAARVNRRLLELVKNAYSANLRRGTADTKTRKEVRGGGKKPWKQKGTGRARASSIRSPIWRGGGTVFGPHPRSYFVNLPKNMRLRALVSALSQKGLQKNLFVVDELGLETPKTREWAEIINSLPLEGKRALCVVKDVDENLERASRNMENLVEICRVRDLNAFHVMQREKLILEEGAVAILEARIFETGTPADRGQKLKPAVLVEAPVKEKKAPRVAAAKVVKKPVAKKAELKKDSKGKKKS